MTDYKSSLLKLNKNLNILREREAKYAGNAPLDLLNQIDDHRTAITLTEQAITGTLSDAEWREALRPLLVAIQDRAEAQAICQVNIGDIGEGILNSIIAGRDVQQTQISIGSYIAQATQGSTATVNVTHIHEAPKPPLPLQRPPRAEHFTDREKELAQLLTDLQPGRVITLCGPGGIGKTALAAEAIWTLASGNRAPERFPDGIIFHSFYNQAQAALALENIARAFGEEPRPTSRDAAQRVLAGRRVLLVLDGAESTDDLQAVLDVAGSCGVLVTSRRRKDAVAERKDIDPLPFDQAVTLLQAWGGTRAADKVSVAQICKLVGALPLAVRLVGSYLTTADEEAADYLKWLKETPLQALDHGDRQHDSIPVLLNRSLKWVSKVAQQTLAVVGLLAPASFSREVIAEVLTLPVSEAGRALGELVNYGLVLRREQRYQISHALIHTYAQERLALPSEATSRLMMYYITLAEQQSELGLPGYQRLDTDRIHLMRMVENCVVRGDLQRVGDLVRAVDSYLDLRGYWTERVTALEAGLKAAKALSQRDDEGVFLGRLGNAYYYFGRMERAIEYYEQALTIAREIGNRRSEGTWLGNLGLAYRNLDQMERAIDYSKQALSIAREIGDPRNEAEWLGNLGNIYRDLGQATQAIGYYERAMIIASEIDDQRRKSISLGNLGLAYRDLGQMERAIDYSEQALSIAREIGHRRIEGAWLGNLGNIYRDLGQMERAIEYYEQALTIAREIGNRRGEGTWLGNLGLAYHDLGQMERAIDYSEQALTIAREVGHRRNEGAWLGNIGNIYRDLGQATRASEYYEQALIIAREIGNRRGEGTWLGNLGLVYRELGQMERAIDYSEQALTIAREVGYRRNEGEWLGNLGNIYCDLGQATQAKPFLEQALIILEEIKSPSADQVRSLLAELK